MNISWIYSTGILCIWLTRPSLLLHTAAHINPTMPPSVARVVPVALIGLGGVGAAILSQLSSPPLAQKFKVVAIANSKKYLFNKDGGINSDGFLEQLNKSGVPLDIPGLIGKLSTLADGEFHPKVAQPVVFSRLHIQRSLRLTGPAILIDSTATDTLPSLYPTILGMNVHLVTPNKKGFSSSLDLYQKIQSTSYPKTGSLVYGESTVGAGLPILSSLKDLVETGDEVGCHPPTRSTWYLMLNLGSCAADHQNRGSLLGYSFVHLQRIQQGFRG